ncbi:MAG: helix-turn-helix domain-containing protein [Candidatus Paceibacterota bacterium]
MNEIINSLKNIGLNEKEARVYLALLKFDETDVSDIALEAGIKRPTTYIILDELRKKGLVLKIPNAKKAIYKAKAPDELYEQSKNSIYQFEKYLPKLRAIAPSKQAIKTYYFEGVDGIKDAMYYRINDLDNSTIEGFWAKNDNIPKAVADIFEKWNIDRQKYKLLISGLTPDHPSTREYVEKYKDFYSNLRFAMPSEYNSDISIEITKEFVRIIDGHEMKGIIIENDRVADTVRQIFKLVMKQYEGKKETEEKF